MPGAPRVTAVLFCDGSAKTTADGPAIWLHDTWSVAVGRLSSATLAESAADVAGSVSDWSCPALTPGARLPWPSGQAFEKLTSEPVFGVGMNPWGTAACAASKV